MKVVAESKVADPTEITLADPVFLRVRGPHALRVRRDPSLSSEHVGTLLAQNVFAFSEVKPGWAKLSPLHYADLQHSKKCCTTADFKEHDIQAQGYCVTVVDGRNVFETPSDDDIQAVLARVRAQSSAAGAKTVCIFKGIDAHDPHGSLADVEMTYFSFALLQIVSTPPNGINSFAPCNTIYSLVRCCLAPTTTSPRMPDHDRHTPCAHQH
jgi:hypothetical protein